MLRLFELVEAHGANLGEPHTKALNDGLFELRAKALEGIARSIYCYVEGKKIIVLHVFVKKHKRYLKKSLISQ
ncbi:type II toxin-antitoxin system RelE/ParE family toxin [Facilibium subflavum]|uniref:type II toxin-antitoxin system RelE/ParE family toxin n=1 Tax=Facilibium subflavum TaxID=2219058 RepID=UPI001F479F34|nr:type II toxin-antitoxin system RelE/ParE family toxin [Facilibium subflavum]